MPKLSKDCTVPEIADRIERGIYSRDVAVINGYCDARELDAELDSRAEITHRAIMRTRPLSRI